MIATWNNVHIGTRLKSRFPDGDLTEPFSVVGIVPYGFLRDATTEAGRLELLSYNIKNEDPVQEYYTWLLIVKIPGRTAPGLVPFFEDYYEIVL